MPVAGDPERPAATRRFRLSLVELRRTLDRIHHALYVECRERGEREASPTAAIIDSQSVKSAERPIHSNVRSTNACTMLLSVDLNGHRSSNARAVGGHSCSLW